MLNIPFDKISTRKEKEEEKNYEKERKKELKRKKERKRQDPKSTQDTLAPTSIQDALEQLRELYNGAKKRIKKREREASYS